MVKRILIYVDTPYGLDKDTSVPLMDHIANFIVQLPPYYDDRKVCFEIREWNSNLNFDRLAQILSLNRPRLMLEYFSIRGNSENWKKSKYKFYGIGWNYVLARSYCVNIRGLYIDLSKSKFEVDRWYKCKVI